MRLLPSPRLLALGAALLVAAPLGRTAHAAPDAAAEDARDLEALRKRFREGMTLESQSKWAEALAIFEEVAKKKMTPHVRFHIALCQENLGKLKSAYDGYGEALALAEADPSAAKEVLDSAPTRKRDLEDKVPVLVLIVAGGGESEVSVDGGPFEKISSRREIRLDPGSHTIGYRTAGISGPERQVTLAPGEKLAIDLPRPAVNTPLPKVDPVKPEPTEPDVEPGTKIPFFVVGGVGVASLVVSGVMIGLRQASIAEVRDSCTGEDTGCDPDLADVAARGKAYEGAAFGLGFAGLACLGAATVLFFTVGQDTPKTQPKVSVQVSGTFASLRATFD